MPHTDAILTMDDIALICKEGLPNYSQHGYVIDKDATIYALTHRFFHGVATAILYPEVAHKVGTPAPAQPLEELDVFAYQRFEHKVARGLPLMRVSVSILSGTTNVSKGGLHATDAQLDALRRVFTALGLAARDTLTGEEGDETVSEYLESLRKAREVPVDLEELALPSEDGASQ